MENSKYDQKSLQQHLDERYPSRQERERVDLIYAIVAIIGWIMSTGLFIAIQIKYR